MGYCNDPKCPLNRQGVAHENHSDIENSTITNPCNDPRCAMNRMGIQHEVHGGKKPTEKPGEQKKSRRVYDEEFHGSADDALQELGKQINNNDSNKISRQKILEERRRRERQTIEQEAREEVKRRERAKRQEQINKQEQNSIKSKIFSRSKSGLPSINQILHSSDHYETFNVSKDSTCDEIKSQYKQLSKNYNAARGSANRTPEEQERLTKAQSKINVAYDFLRKNHCG